MFIKEMYHGFKEDWWAQNNTEKKASLTGISGSSIIDCSSARSRVPFVILHNTVSLQFIMFAITK